MTAHIARATEFYRHWRSLTGEARRASPDEARKLLLEAEASLVRAGGLAPEDPRVPALLRGVRHALNR